MHVLVTASIAFTADQTNTSKYSCVLIIGLSQLFHNTFSASEVWNFLVESTGLNNSGFSAISVDITRIWHLQLTLVAIQTYNFLMLLLKLKSQYSLLYSLYSLSLRNYKGIFSMDEKEKIQKKPQKITGSTTESFGAAFC